MIGRGSKANHLSYLGDTTIGEKVNIGAGTITCNYDGYKKFQTVIEDGAFIGSDSQLVAPVRIGRRAVVGAGTTVTRDVTAGALALSRVPQVERPGYADKVAERYAGPLNGARKRRRRSRRRLRRPPGRANDLLQKRRRSERRRRPRRRRRQKRKRANPAVSDSDGARVDGD